MGRNLSFSLVTIMSQVFTLSFPFFTLSTCILSHHNEAWPFSFRKVDFTLSGSYISSISKYLSISMAQPIKYSRFRLPEKVDTSIANLPFISNNTFKNLSLSSSSTSSLGAFSSLLTSSSLWSRIYNHISSSNIPLMFLTHVSDFSWS